MLYTTSNGREVEIPENMYVVDPGFKRIAFKDYTKRELIRKGAEIANNGQYLVIRSQNRHRGIDLVFEKGKNRRWAVTEENRKILFGFDVIESEEYLDQLVDEVEKGSITDSRVVVNRLKILRDIM